MDIHRCRFVPFNPQAINALAFSHPPLADLAGRGVPTLRLAVGRANGDIEIWNPMRGAWFQETILRGGKDRSVEGLVWTLDPPEEGPDGRKLPGRLRLFSIGYSTTVTEWDLEQGRPLRHSSGNYGEIWCLAAQPRWQATQRGKDGKLLPPAEGEFIGQHLAAGCADGSVVILSTADGDLQFLRLMRPSTKRARVLTVTFQNRHTVVAGYADSSIRVFDIRSGQLLRTISLGKGPAGGPKEILVWSVKCLPDGTIVSGDSTGEIRFWDAKNYSLIQRVQGHLADVLDVAVSASGDTVISGGADQRTVVYRKKQGDKNDKRARWAEVMHRRYHTHDVKTFSIYETKEISIVVSGGPDATPVVLPLREFGREHHRKLSSLPQIPQLSSSPSSRLVMSFWDREISIWRVFRGPTSPYQTPDGQKHRLVGKVLVQGEENITSAMLSPDGKILAVATISSIKVFSIRRRKGDERGALRVQKLDVPSGLSDDGARIVTVSPDSKWLCVVRPSSDIYLARIEPASNPQEKPQILPQLTKVNRISRHTRHEKASHGTLGNYERTIRCVAFSANSKILSSGDLSGCVDTWVLEKSASNSNPLNGATKSDDDSSDDDEGDEQPVIDGERWRLAAPDSPIPRLKSGVVLMSFRPQYNPNSKLLTDNADKTANGSPSQDDRLMVLTSEHQLVEFNSLDGKLSDWSRRNPKACLPAEFRGVKDRAMGCIWDVFGGRERLWLYGNSWMWMFDLTQDFPSPQEMEESGNKQESSGKVAKESSSSLQKRKRDPLEEDGEQTRKKQNSGAGDRIPLSEADISLGPKIRKFVGTDESQAEWISLDEKEQRKGSTNGDEEEYEYDETSTENNELALAQLRRGRGINGVEENGSTSRKALPDAELANADASSQQQQQQKESADAESSTPRSARRWWHTYKYRDILGIVPLNSVSSVESDDEDKGMEGEENAANDNDNDNLEVAVVERPMWDVELPGRYVRDYE